MPNVFLIDIQPSQKHGVERLIRRMPGMDASLEIVPVAQVRLTAIERRWAAVAQAAGIRAASPDGRAV